MNRHALSTFCMWGSLAIIIFLLANCTPPLNCYRHGDWIESPECYQLAVDMPNV